MNKSEKKLIAYYDTLAPQERELLLSFAEFLAGRSQKNNTIEQPVIIERPAKESVIAAIKRLSACYFMLDKTKLLSEVSEKVTQHVVHGREISEVIDELEQEFKQQYDIYLNEKTELMMSSSTNQIKP